MPGWLDLVLFGVKLWDTETAAEATKPLLGAGTGVVSFQNGAQSRRVLQFRDACADSGIDAEISDQIEQDIWEKFVFIVGLSGTTSLVRSAIGPIRSHPRSRAFLHDVLAEVVQTARAQGVPLPADYADQRMAFVDQLAPDMTSSMFRDLEHGYRLEVDWLSGDVVERGARLGVATPCNRAIADILSVYSAGHPATP